jgi:hypothetical protein
MDKDDKGGNSSRRRNRAKWKEINDLEFIYNDFCGHEILKPDLNYINDHLNLIENGLDEHPRFMKNELNEVYSKITEIEFSDYFLNANDQDDTMVDLADINSRAGCLEERVYDKLSRGEEILEVSLLSMHNHLKDIYECNLVDSNPFGANSELNLINKNIHHIKNSVYLKNSEEEDVFNIKLDILKLEVDGLKVCAYINLEWRD